ncbi:MAG: GPW/gp25 family protein [Roseiarcus sp.]|jgi:phage baseplate assembly protein W
MRTGVDRNTGAVLTGWDHCLQSILDIVSTAIGSRVIARAYGSNAPDLIDRPQTPPAIVAHFSAIAEALRLWEPGFRLKQISATRLGPDGVAGFALAGDYYPNGHLGDYSIVEPMQTLAVPLPAIF